MKRLTRKRLLLVALVCASCNPMRGCQESNFVLSADSRLPKWFAIPAGYSRADLNVKLDYYTPFAKGVDDAVMELVDRKGRSLSSATGQMCWHPMMHSKTNSEGGLDPDSYPHYAIVTVRGISEVFEHIRGPVFSVSDDSTLVSQARESLSKGECRKEP